MPDVVVYDSYLKRLLLKYVVAIIHKRTPIKLEEQNVITLFNNNEFTKHID